MNNASNNSNIKLPDGRTNSAEFASELLADAAEWIDALLDHDKRMGIAPKHAALVSTHALLSLLDFEGGRIAKALEEIAESLDFLAARSDVYEASESPTEHERVVIYRALEADYMKSGHPLTSINEMDAALLRFKKLAGL